MKKRLISLALTLALCLGLAVPALAAEAYRPYTLTGSSYGSPYTITFSAAKTEQKTVQIREHYDIDDEYTAYQKAAVTFVTIKPDTKVTVSNGDVSMVGVTGVSADGNDRYTQIVMGAPETIENGTGRDAFVSDFQTVYLYSDTGSYLITIDSSVTPSGFTDVNPTDYYADAVKWAVDRKITSGTSSTTFSPKKTCSVAEILTFLWNANGQPEPTGRNPFSDISTGDYFYKAAVWAAGKGLVSGNKLNPSTPCTRAMVMEYLWKLAGRPNMNVPTGYGPQTITGITSVYNIAGDSVEVPCSLEFSDAIVENTVIRVRENHAIEASETKVTLIKVLGRSNVTIKGAPYVYVEDYVHGDDDVYDPTYREGVNLISGTFNSRDEKEYDDYELKCDTYELVWFKGKSGRPYMIQIMPVSLDFSDVSSTATYTQAVSWAVKQGITAGTGDMTFSPNNTCTRGEIVTFLHRAMG